MVSKQSTSWGPSPPHLPGSIYGDVFWENGQQRNHQCVAFCNFEHLTFRTCCCHGYPVGIHGNAHWPPPRGVPGVPPVLVVCVVRFTYDVRYDEFIVTNLHLKIISMPVSSDKPPEKLKFKNIGLLFREFRGASHFQEFWQLWKICDSYDSVRNDIPRIHRRVLLWPLWW